MSIVSTSLISITDDLKGFSQGSWVVTAYLITYTGKILTRSLRGKGVAGNVIADHCTFPGLLIVWAKLSDIFGRKTTLIVSLVTFMAFSGACGASQTVEQL